MLLFFHSQFLLVILFVDLVKVFVFYSITIIALVSKILTQYSSIDELTFIYLLVGWILASGNF